MKALIAATAIAVLTAATAFGETIRLAWDYPTNEANKVTFRLYANTNVAPASLTNWLVKLDAGTNQTATVSNASPGLWFFAATAVSKAGGIESVRSDVLTVEITEKPTNLRTVILQWNATVNGTNWLDVGFFKIKFGP